MAFLSRERAPNVNFVEILITQKKLQKNKKIDFHKTTRGGGGHRFMKLFHKNGFSKYE